MEDSERHIRKRKRASRPEPDERHHDHTSSHWDKSKSRHQDLHNQDLHIQDLPFSLHTYAFPQSLAAERAQRRQDAPTTILDVALSVTLATSTPPPGVVIPAMPQTLTINRNPPNIGLNTETTFPTSQQSVPTPSSIPTSTSPSGERLPATRTEEPDVSVAGIASTTVPSPITSYTPTHTSSETLPTSNNSTVIATSMSAQMNTTSASIGTMASITSSNNGSDTRSIPTSTQASLITSDGVLLIPVFTTAIRIGIPISSDGSLVGTSFVTSYSTLYGARSTSSFTLTPSSTVDSSSSGPGNGNIASLTQTGSPDATGTSRSGNLTSNADSNGASVPTPTVVGGVVGGVAGITVILLLALVLLRWYKRRKGGSIQGLDDAYPSRPGTSTTAGSAAVAGVCGAATAAGGLGLFKRLSRRVGPAPSQPPPPPLMTEVGASEGSFQRIGGRKLPSQFSPGVEGPGRSYPSGSSHYPSGGTYASSAMTADNPFADPHTYTPSPAIASFAGAAGAAGAGGLSGLTGARQEPASQAEQDGLIQPGPARTPEIHQGDSFRTSSHLPNDWPLPASMPLARSPSFNNNQHPALRPGSVSAAPSTGAAVSLLQQGGRGTPEFRRGMPPVRVGSRSRFVEDEM